jgi:hypothetical protein
MITELAKRQSSADRGIVAGDILAQDLGSSGRWIGYFGTFGHSTADLRSRIAVYGSSSGFYKQAPLIPERPSSMDKLFEDIIDFQTLPIDWNGHGSEAPNEIAVTLARNVLAELNSVGLAPERIAPSAEGGVAVCFRRGNRFASIECLNSGDTIGLISDGAGNPRAWDVGSDSRSITDAVKLIREHIHSRPAR